MNDNNKRALQWQRLVGEYFVPLLGGSTEAWSRANRVVADRLFEPTAWRRRVHAAHDYRSFDRAYQVEWLRSMCELVGIEIPPEEECLHLARRAKAFITRRVQAAFPGVVDAIRTLPRQGYMLHTASGESSLDLSGYLHAMWVRDCFSRLYGPDLIGAFKASQSTTSAFSPILVSGPQTRWSLTTTLVPSSGRRRWERMRCWSGTRHSLRRERSFVSGASSNCPLCLNSRADDIT